MRVSDVSELVLITQSEESSCLRYVKECSENKLWKSGAVPYFCGDHDDCWNPTEEGFQRAIKNLELE